MFFVVVSDKCADAVFMLNECVTVMVVLVVS